MERTETLTLLSLVHVDALPPSPDGEDRGVVRIEASNRWPQNWASVKDGYFGATSNFAAVLPTRLLSQTRPTSTDR